MSGIILTPFIVGPIYLLMWTIQCIKWIQEVRDSVFISSTFICYVLSFVLCLILIHIRVLTRVKDTVVKQRRIRRKPQSLLENISLCRRNQC